MCGVFGFVSVNDRAPDLGRLERVAAVTERRGHHAFGFAWLDGRGRMRSYRSAGRITDNLPLLAMAADARLLVGHCRYATQGHPLDNINNHPHPCDGGWIVHNGMIADYRGLVARHGLCPSSECDSELLGLLIEQDKGPMIDRCVRAARLAASRPLVLLGLWRGPDRVIAVRDGNPLHAGYAKEGTYLASLADDLPGKVEMLADREAYEFGPVAESSRGSKREPSGRTAKVKARSTSTPRTFPFLTQTGH